MMELNFLDMIFISTIAAMILSVAISSVVLVVSDRLQDKSFDRAYKSFKQVSKGV